MASSPSLLNSHTSFLKTSQLKDIRKVLFHLPENAVIFLDVDDTLITPKSKLFRPSSPYRLLIDDIKKHPDLYPHAELIISQWRLQRAVQLVNEEWPELISLLQETHKVYALTQLHSQIYGSIPSMEKWRYDELKNKRISFTPSFNGDEEKIILPRDEQHPFAATFYKGIFITGTYKKSDVVKAFLETENSSQIILIDDRESHLQNTQEECNRQNIPFTGILYTGTLKLPGEPNPEIAAFQKETLLKKALWLEDEEAERQGYPSPLS